MVDRKALSVSDALTIDGDAALLKIESGERRRPADRDEEVRSADPSRPVVAFDDDGRSRLDADGLMTGHQVDAVLRQLRQHHIGCGAILAVEHLATVDDRHL